MIPLDGLLNRNANMYIVHCYVVALAAFLHPACIFVFLSQRQLRDVHTIITYKRI